MQSMQGCGSEIQLPYVEIYWEIYSRWYDLKSKPGKDKNKPRGKLEVVVSFLVKAGSLTDLSKKHQSSMGQLSRLAQSVGMFALDMSITVT
jgi:Rab11 family-interacting protein 1/2/5